MVTENVVVPGANHFTILEELLRPGSPVLTRITELARDVDGGVRLILASHIWACVEHRRGKARQAPPLHDRDFY